MLHKVEKIDGLYKGFCDVKARSQGLDITHREMLFSSETLYLVYDQDAHCIIDAADLSLCVDTLTELKSDYQENGFPLSALVVYVSKKISADELKSLQEKHARLEPLRETYEKRELSPLLGLRTIELA